MLHGEIGAPRVIPEIEHLEDVGVGQVSEGLGFPSKPFPEFGIGAIRGRDHLERDVPSDGGLSGQVDGGHATFTKNTTDDIGTDARPSMRRRRRSRKGRARGCRCSRDRGGGWVALGGRRDGLGKGLRRDGLGERQGGALGRQCRPRPRLPRKEAAWRARLTSGGFWPGNCAWMALTSGMRTTSCTMTPRTDSTRTRARRQGHKGRCQAQARLGSPSS